MTEATQNALTIKTSIYRTSTVTKQPIQVLKPKINGDVYQLILFSHQINFWDNVPMGNIYQFSTMIQAL